MQVSVISDDYSQNSKALILSQKNSANVAGFTKNDYYNNSSLQKETKAKKETIEYNIQEWKNFCHKQILKGKLDIIA